MYLFPDTDSDRPMGDHLCSIVLAFSGGPRSCIGQRFAVTESVCIIACIVRQYEILPPEDMLGLGFEEQKRRLTQWKPGATIIPTNARVQFRRREV